MKLSKKVKKELSEAFSGLKGEVTFKLFTQEMECRFCEDTRALLEAVTDASDKVKLEIYDFVKDKAEADIYGVDKIPAIVAMDGKDYGIKYYGIPGGYEFASLVEVIKLISTGEHGLKPETMEFLNNLQKDIHLQVFVTPTCPYCPGAVVLAHKMAYYSPRIKADMIEATEFPHLSQKYNVMGVPRTVIQETGFLEGSAPEEMLIDRIKSVL
ncbi:MAG: glutaredoxin [bacterium]|nr:glutaredoxin [bacterium]